MTTARALITRADLAKALDKVVDDDTRLAAAIAMCEAWEPGYIATLLLQAEVLVANSADGAEPGATPTDRSLSAIRRSIETSNPLERLARSGAAPTQDAIDALRRMLGSRAEFHETADPLERRALRREPPKR